MYSNAFCKVYNEFGWNYFPRAFGEQLLEWIAKNNVTVNTSMDLACGTGILCEVLADSGIEASGMDFSEGMIDIADLGHEYFVLDPIRHTLTGSDSGKQFRLGKRIAVRLVEADRRTSHLRFKLA